MAELPVGGHQEQSLGVVVQSTHRQKPVRFLGHQVGDGLSVFGVRERGDDLDRFIQHQGRGGLAGADIDPVDRDGIPLGVRLRAQGLDDLPVDLDPPLFDVGFRFAPGRHTGSR